MRGDFTAIRFDPARHFSRVLLQQGRVMLDDDVNQMSAITTYLMRALAADVIGSHGGPVGSFAITALGEGSTVKDFEIAPGHYYVDGILCENELRLNADGNPVPLRYSAQPDFPIVDSADELPDGPMLVYIDVWERFVSATEDESIREVALGGPDTCGRARVIWQVRWAALESGTTCADMKPTFGDLVAQWQPADRGRLRAQTEDVSGDPDLCVVPASARFRGTENQLYRVEIHRGGVPWDGIDPDDGATNLETAATFKWSRDNGSTVYAVADDEGGRIIELESLGRDARSALSEGDLVEPQWDTLVLRPPRTPPDLLTVEDVDRTSRRVTLSAETGGATLLRRWDGTGAVQEMTGDDWITLEDGVQVQFVPGPADRRYRGGDYWLIPARTETGNVEWPRDGGGPVARPPAGVDHHFAPLAVVFGDAADGPQANSCRREIKTVTT